MMKRLVVGLVAATLVVLVVAPLAIARFQGFSVRSEPTAVERTIARLTRRWATPAAARAAVNPIRFSDAIWADARAHFADHCATCHANDGSGSTEIGRNLYPRAPDMRRADTQGLTDGELYWIIENGVRLTGMPAWGTGGGDDRDTWKLVHFIRHLEHLTPAHLKDMEALNPKTASERDEEREDDQFLSGEPPSGPPAHHHHKE